MKTANENGVKYIQLDIGFFDNKKIKAIRGLPSGSDILVIWIELLVLAGQINDCGSIYFNHEVPYTADMLANQFGFPLATIQLALTTFVKFEMVEIIDDVIMISNWRKYQNENALERIRELANARQQRHRQKIKEQKALESGERNVTCNVVSNAICHENCSYISNSIYSSLSEDNEDKDTGSGEKGKEPKKGRKSFVKPTVEEISAYCRERGNGIDADAFFDKYESNGWVDKNGNPMKDWKATIRTWERWRKDNPGQKKRVSAQQYEQRDYASGELDAVSDDLIAEARKART